MRQVYSAPAGNTPVPQGDTAPHASPSDTEAIRQALARLPAAVAEGLRRATLTADIDRVLALTEEIAAVDSGLAAELRRLAEAFEYERLAALLPVKA